MGLKTFFLGKAMTYKKLAHMGKLKNHIVSLKKTRYLKIAVNYKNLKMLKILKALLRFTYLYCNKTAEG